MDINGDGDNNPRLDTRLSFFCPSFIVCSSRSDHHPLAEVLVRIIMLMLILMMNFMFMYFTDPVETGLSTNSIVN